MGEKIKYCQLGLKVPQELAERFRKAGRETGLSGPELLDWAIRLFETDPKVTELRAAAAKCNEARVLCGLLPMDPFRVGERHRRK